MKEDCKVMSNYNKSLLRAIVYHNTSAHWIWAMNFRAYKKKTVHIGWLTSSLKGENKF